MNTCAIVGINWGDEGKGRMVDLIAEDYDIIVRYQGGNNAGHTIVNEYGKFALNLLPSGIFRKSKLNVLGNGTVIDLKHLCAEIDAAASRGVSISPHNLRISDRATIVMPYHVMLDELEEQRLSERKFGSTKRGIAPAYGDKYMKRSFMMGELFDAENLKRRLADAVEFKNLLLTRVYGAEPLRFDDMLEYLTEYGELLKPYICDAGKLIRERARRGSSILYEAQLGALRDIDFGIYPYTSSSTPLAAYAPVGAGATGIPVNRVIGVVKAYSTCVGEGPFVTEWQGDAAERLRQAGGEYGAATGRPRRVGAFDVVASRYGVAVQGATELAITKLDVLSGMEKIPVCIEYELNGERTGDFPLTPLLERSRPVYAEMDGWNCDISGVRRYEELPVAARVYVEFIEREMDCPITYVSVGAGRDEIIYRSAR
ncbi:MAG: adenylosuccinate synthase [Clostridia bacterium]|nr:adenylosuccinate synthase [Clostridia bacterium]